MTRILVVEDDPAMSVALRDGFDFEGYEVLMANDGVRGLELARSSSPDLMVLDVMLPRESGLDVCKKLRTEENDIPIIMLTARGQEIDKIVGLKTGADDYVTKPFSFMELLARVEAVLRRSKRLDVEEVVEFGDVCLNFRNFEAKKGEEQIDLSPLEFRLMKYLVERTGEVVPREELLDSVWGYDSTAYTRTVDTHIARLRQKIEEIPHNPRHLLTVHRVGYKFVS